MLTPIFTYDIQRTMQQRWFHLARVLFAAIVLLLFLWHLSQVTTFLARPDFRRSLPTFLGQTREFQHYLMVIDNITQFLITPILAAGPILQEKRQKTLELLLTTQQRSANIILGHWVAAIAKLLILTSPVIPLLIWMHSFAGASPIHWMMAWLACTSLLAMPLTAWPLLVAVYARQTFSALLWSYAGNVLLVVALFAVFRDAQLSLWSHADYDGAFWRNFTVIVAVPTALCLWIAIWRLRPAFGAAPEREVRSARNRPTLEVSDQPILWRQTHCNHVLMPRFVRWLPEWARLSAFVAITAAIASLPDSSGIWSTLEGFGAPVVFAVAAIVMGGNSINIERETGTWDSLRLTLVNGSEMVNETLTPLVKASRRYWLALIPAVVLSVGKQYGVLPIWEFCFVVLAGIVLWVVTGFLLYHAAVAGLSSAVSSNTSTGSLIYAISTFGGFVAIIGMLSAFGAGVVGFSLCLFVCMVGRMSEGLAILLFAMNVIITMMLFFFFAHILLRYRSGSLCKDAIENLATHHGFQRAPEPGAARHEG